MFESETFFDSFTLLVTVVVQVLLSHPMLLPDTEILAKMNKFSGYLFNRICTLCKLILRFVLYPLDYLTRRAANQRK